MSWSKIKIDREEVERAARMYPSGAAAARALGIYASTFMDLCRRLGVDPPHKRKQRLKEEETQDDEGRADS